VQAAFSWKNGFLFLNLSMGHELGKPVPAPDSSCSTSSHAVVDFNPSVRYLRSMIRKAIIKEIPEAPSQWMDLTAIARFEITSEDPEHPMEFALNADEKYWRAAADGEQTIRIIFDAPQKISKIVLLFEEKMVPRTQQFTLLWQRGSEAPVEFVRQQYNFSPPGTTQERESYDLSLADVSALELVIKPDISKPARASLTQLLVA
jgi:hypothetical protein